jgi:hypothetical protein
VGTCEHLGVLAGVRIRSWLSIVLVPVVMWTVVLWSPWSPAPARPAPSPSALPVPPEIDVLVAREGGSDIDTANDPNNYLYMALAGPVGWSPTKLMVTEVSYLIAHGWGDTEPYAVPLTPAAADVSTVTRVALTSRGANVLINGPRNIYAALSPVRTFTDAQQEFDMTPIYAATSIIAAVQRRAPVLSVSLGNGKHG